MSEIFFRIPTNTGIDKSKAKSKSKTVEVKLTSTACKTCGSPGYNIQKVDKKLVKLKSTVCKECGSPGYSITSVKPGASTTTGKIGTLTVNPQGVQYKPANMQQGTTPSVPNPGTAYPSKGVANLMTTIPMSVKTTSGPVVVKPALPTRTVYVGCNCAECLDAKASGAPLNLV